MLQLAETNSSTIDAITVDERSDAELDALPFGVVALDRDGTVLRYNLYESRLARLDRNQVVGRHFFQEIAPCTRTAAFEGRFREFVEANVPARVERFEYVFDFKFGAQDVTIDMVRARSAPRFYLLINRRKVGAPREVPREQLAAAQVDLAPDEDRAGVLRDDLERRFVDAPAPLFAALRATCDRLAPDTWQLFANEWGVQWGRRAAVDLEAAALEREGRSLRELPMRVVAVMIAGYFAERGWGAPSFDLGLADGGILKVDLARSALAESAARPKEGAPDLTCHLFAGSVAAILTAIAGRRLTGREIACAAGGAPHCTIAVVGHERRSSLDAALAAGARGDEVLAALERPKEQG
jgi:photoactive yellow protein